MKSKIVSGVKTKILPIGSVLVFLLAAYFREVKDKLTFLALEQRRYGLDGEVCISDMFYFVKENVLSLLFQFKVMYFSFAGLSLLLLLMVLSNSKDSGFIKVCVVLAFLWVFVLSYFFDWVS